MDSDILIGCANAVIPKMASMLNTLEPIRLPIDISVSFLYAATAEVTNSGTEVPKATAVTEMNFSDI